jgi:O-6-methylguanine DNA methyltransferase
MTRTSIEGLYLFETKIGTCGLAWTDCGIDRIQLPEKDRETTLARLMARAPGREISRRPPAHVRDVARRIRAHLGGRLDPMLDVPIDLASSSAFAQRVYRELRRVAPGEVTTYADLARRAGNSGASRAVGRAVGANPIPLIIPCHRVVTAQHTLGGFSAYDGKRLKARLLFIEGVVLDPEAADVMKYLRRRDPVLRKIIDAVGPVSLREFPTGDPYEALVESILYQQLAGRAAAAIAARFRALTPGPKYPQPAQVLKLTEKQLRSAGLSGQKLSYVRDLARCVHAGELKLNSLRRLDDEAVIEQLTQVRGIGRWSAEMYLIFHLRRPDVLPVDDYGLRAAVQGAYGMKELPNRKELQAMGERWRPYRSLATCYFWQRRDVK